MLLKIAFALKSGFILVFAFFHATAWGFDEEEFLKVDIRPYLSVSYGAASVDGCEDLSGNGRCDDVVTGEEGSFAGAAGIMINDYLGLEVGYLPGFSVDEFGGASDFDEIKIEGGYVAPRISLPINEKTRIFAKPGAFWGKLTETDDPSASGAFGVFDEEGVGLFLDVGVDHSVTRSFSFQLGATWLPDIAGARILDSVQRASDAAGETAEIDVIRVYIGVSLSLF